jgi:S1-C subfamily serine protease
MSIARPLFKRFCRLGAVSVSLLTGLIPLFACAPDLDPRVRDAEQQRIAVIEKVKPAVVAIFSQGGQGGGSGVLVSKDGYALSNFHVVEGAGPVMQCGLPDGVLYDGVLVGLDKVGDVALIKLLPREGRQFPAASLGDSDTVRAGDWSLALGNPFLLATDFQPTVTYGLVSGVHRYQYPAGTLLEYTDCIQVETSINPGNSGGPLFDLNGELVGINGRGSFEKRGRVNSGAGYAISINQIKNFIGHLRAGLDTDHATLGATIRTDTEDDNNRLVIDAVIDNSDAHRRGLDADDELVSFAGRPVSSVNQYKNVLGLFPKGWRVPVVYRRKNEKHEILVRLMQLQQTQAPEDAGKPRQRPGPPRRPAPATNSPAAKLYEPRPGFANYHFNKMERDRLLAGFRAHGEFASIAGEWRLEGRARLAQGETTFALSIREEPAASGTKAAATLVSARTLVRLTLGNLRYDLDPLQVEQDAHNLKDPPGSGGLLTALYQYRRLLSLGPAGFEGGCHHNGYEPLYPPAANGRTPASINDLRVDTEVLASEHAAVPAKWYFSRADQALLGFEVTTGPEDDPCEVYLADNKKVDGRLLPHRIEVRYGNDVYGVFTVNTYQLSAAPTGGH